MFRRASALIGTILFGSATLLGMMWLMSSSFSVARADPTFVEINPDLTAGAALYRPTDQAATQQGTTTAPGVASDNSPDTSYTAMANVLLSAGNSGYNSILGSDGPLHITKTANVALARVGDDVTYYITVCNTAGTGLDKWSVVDSLIPGVDASFSSVLPAQSCEAHSFVRTVQAGDPSPLINTVTANYQVQESPVTLVATDTHEVRLPTFEIEVTKSGDALAQVGDDVNYSIQVCNASDATLNKLSVTDNLIPGVNGAYNSSLSPGACETHTFVRTVQPSDPYPWLTNVVTATYQVDGQPDILTGTDTHTVRLVTPLLDVIKSGDANGTIGADVNYSIQVCNNGDVALNKLDVNDSLIPGVNASYGSSLSPGACETHNFARTVQPTDPYPWLTNVVTATYQVDGLPDILTATDTHTVRLFAPGLNIIKTGDALAQVGDDVTYPITVCNTGASTLDKVSVVDSLIPGVDSAFGASLPPGVCESHTFVRTVQPTDPYPWLTNFVTATYQLGGQPDVITATDSHTVRLIAPDLSVTKTGDTLAQVGDNVNYSIQVCNNGDVTLNKISVSDNLIPGVNASYGPSLSPGACETHNFVRRVQSSDPYPWLTNIATARYQVDGLPDVLTATDSHTVRLANPGLEVTKTGDTLARAGEDVNYSIRVCNTGDIGLNKTSVTDDLIPNVNHDYGSSLSPGACETHNFVRTVLPTDPHPWLTNTVTAIYRVNGLPDTLSAVDSHVVRLTTPHLDVTKTGDAFSRVGADVTYHIMVCNTGYMTLTRLSVVDSLIPGVDDAYGPSLLPGACETRDFVRTVLPTDPDPFTNTVTATYQVTGWSDILVATDTHSVAMPETDLLIAKSAHPPQGPPKAPITFIISFTNNSSITVPSAVITDWLPADTHYLADTSGFPCSACDAGATGPLTWTVPSLPPYSTHSFNLQLMHNDPPCEGTLTNTVAITTVILDTNPGNNRATATYHIVPAVDLVVIKDDNIAPWTTIYPGERITYTIVYTNDSPCPATDVVLVETLPQYTDYVGFGWNHVSGRTYTQAVGNLLPGQSGQAIVVVQMRTDDFPVGVSHITNTVRVDAREPEMSPPNDTSDVTTPLGSDWKLYVANWKSGTLDVFSATDFDYLRTITLTTMDGRRGAPFGMAVSGTHLYVADFGDDTDPSTRSPLYVIDTASDNVIHMSPVGRHAIHVAVYQGLVYVANHSKDLEGLTIISATAPYDVVDRLSCDEQERCFGYGFFGITVDQKRGRIYTTKRDNYHFGVWILTPTLDGPELGFVETGGHPTSALYNPDDDLLYVTYGLIDQLWVFDPNNGLTVTQKITTGHQDPVDPGFGGHGLAATGQCIFVSNYKDESITAIINERCVDEPEPALVITQTGSYDHAVYLPLVGRNFVFGPLIIPLSGRPKGMTIKDNLLFVTLPVDGNEQAWNKVAIIDLRKMRVVREITVRGDHPHTVILAKSSIDRGSARWTRTPTYTDNAPLENASTYFAPPGATPWPLCAPPETTRQGQPIRLRAR